MVKSLPNLLAGPTNVKALLLTVALADYGGTWLTATAKLMGTTAHVFT